MTCQKGARVHSRNQILEKPVDSRDGPTGIGASTVRNSA